MTTDTQVKPDAAVLWGRLGQAKLGLKKYEEAETAFKKCLEVNMASNKPEVQGLAQEGLGEVYAREGKADEAASAFDAAVKANPPDATQYLRNETLIFAGERNAAAQVAAADKAIAVDPNNALFYYLKGEGLLRNATIDPKTKHVVLPPECVEAHQKYLQLSPDGPYAPEVKRAVNQTGQMIQ